VLVNERSQNSVNLKSDSENYAGIARCLKNFKLRGFRRIQEIVFKSEPLKKLILDNPVPEFPALLPSPFFSPSFNIIRSPDLHVLLLLPILSSISQVPEYKRQAYFDAPSPAHG
jgi:hypothetical protein